MPDARHTTRGQAVLLVLSLVLAIALVGCDVTIEEPQGSRNDTQRRALSVGVAQLPEYDVAISALDFDPPFRPETTLANQRSIKLLAAVENRGTTPLTNLVVEAHVSNQKGDLSAKDRTVIEKLSPGETKLVEFEGVAPEPMMPRSPLYRILVSVQSRQPDAHPQNNSREVVARVSE